MEENQAYSKNQVTLGTFFGGPLAATYMLKKNFDVMGDATHSQKTIKYGLIFTLALILISPMLPSSIPGVVYGMAYTMAARSFYIQKQETLKDTPRFSNWNVAGVALLSLLAFLAVGLPIVYLYYATGILQD